MAEWDTIGPRDVRLDGGYRSGSLGNLRAWKLRIDELVRVPAVYKIERQASAAE